MTDVDDLERRIERDHREVSNDIADLKTQLTTQVAHLFNQLEKYVLRDVHTADLKAIQASIDTVIERLAGVIARVSRLEEAESSRGKDKRGVYLAAIGAVLGSIATAVINHYVGK